MGSEQMGSEQMASGRASSESAVRVRRDPEGWLRRAWEEETPRALAAGLTTLSFGYRAAHAAGSTTRASSPRGGCPVRWSRSAT
jgi:hypothetical protein